MCTAITLLTPQNENYFGRTMDFSYPIEPGIFVMPRHYRWQSLVSDITYTNTYSFIGIGQKVDDMLGLFDGVNEKGFAAAVLYFEGYAYYDFPVKNKEPLAAIDMLHYMLGRCASVEDVKKMVTQIQIVGVADPVTQRAAPLHWIATDRSGETVVIEQTVAGLEVIPNPLGVMANSPDLRWHMTNLRNYMDLSVTQVKEVYWGDVLLKPFSQGAGTMHLPGGFTSPDRFVRTAFLKTHIATPHNQHEAVLACFHIMNSVSIPKGIVITERGVDDFTKYVAFINTNTCEYFFKTYMNDQIRTVKLTNYPLQSKEPLFLGVI